MKRWCLILVTSALMSQPTSVHPGGDRWEIKTSLAVNSDLAHPREISIESFLALPEPPAVGMSRLQKVRMSESVAGFHEGDILSLQGWLHLVALESDGDYHMQLSVSQESGDHCAIVEIPSPDFVQSGSLASLLRQGRQIVRQRVLRGHEPSTSGDVLRHPARVQVVGALFFDGAHVGDMPRGKKGMHADTRWELHPVTSVKFLPSPGQVK
jgi:hypothetical protein